MNIFLLWLIYGAAIGVSAGIITLILGKLFKNRIEKKITGSHSVVITAYEELKTIRKNKQPITIKVQMTEWTADAIEHSQHIGLKYNDFLNYCWFDYHEKLEKERRLGMILIDPEEAYWFGEKPNFGEKLTEIMKEHDVLKL